MQRKLFHSVDSVSEKADKYQDHGTAVIKLVPKHIGDAMRVLRKELDVGAK